jgi:hypothetical protein
MKSTCGRCQRRPRHNDPSIVRSSPGVPRWEVSLPTQLAALTRSPSGTARSVLLFADVILRAEHGQASLCPEAWLAPGDGVRSVREALARLRSLNAEQNSDSCSERHVVLL